MTEIEIKDEIYKEIKRRIEESQEFNSVEEYVNFVLQEVLKENEEETVYTKEEEEEIKRRLRDLGYL
jgi:Arc/MetJ-type ribon-helix-helix transcriptional regulator